MSEPNNKSSARNIPALCGILLFCGNLLTAVILLWQPSGPEDLDADLIRSLEMAGMAAWLGGAIATAISLYRSRGSGKIGRWNAYAILFGLFSLFALIFAPIGIRS